MTSGRVDIRWNQKTQKARIRFYGAAPDQVEMLEMALAYVRKETGTQFDTVALEWMCMAFLAVHPKAVTLKSAP